jgi:hypothetical protein
MPGTEQRYADITIDHAMHLENWEKRWDDAPVRVKHKQSSKSTKSSNDERSVLMTKKEFKRLFDCREYEKLWDGALQGPYLNKKAKVTSPTNDDSDSDKEAYK